MECLTAFVILVILPLVLVALGMSLRARRVARAAARETELLAQTVRGLLARSRTDQAAAEAPAPAVASGAPAAAAAGGASTRAAARAPSAADVAALDAAARATAASPPPHLTAAGAASAAADAAAAARAASGEAAGAGAAIGAAASPPPPPPAAPAFAPAEPPPAGPSWEERLGARLPVWIGAIALVLAAAFLVKLSFDKGWIGPTVRVTLGALFGVSLLVGGELMRRSSRQIAQGLTAAGIAVMFVVELAAVHLYHLIGPATGFALMALTTATAVALALLHGPFVALLGLVGGFLTPVLVSTGQPDAPLLFGYLALLQAGLLAVSRRRGWWPLGGLTVLAALAWALGWTAGPFGAADAAVVGTFLVVAVVGALLASAGSGERFGQPLAGWIRAVAAGGALVVAGVLAVRAEYGLVEWGFLGLLAAGCLVLARLWPELEGLAWLAAGVVCLIVGSWAEQLQAADAPRFFGVAVAALLLLAGGAWALQRGARRPARWAALAATATLALDLLAWYAADAAQVELPWGWIELALAAVWIVLALPVARRREAIAGGDAVLAAAAAAATALVSLAVPMELERQWISVAWALEVAALVWLAGRLRVPLLAHLAALLTALVGARLLLNPAVLEYPTGDHPLLSWLLYGYGVPIAALAAAAVLARRRDRRALAAGIGGVSVALAVMFLALAVHQAFHPGMRAVRPSLGEWGTLTTLWLLLACGLLFAAARTPAAVTAAAPAGDAPPATSGVSPPPATWHPYPELRFGGALIVFLALAQAALAQGVIANPLLEYVSVGRTPVWNVLLLAYGAPLVLLSVAAALERRVEERSAPRWSLVPRLWTLASLVLLFALVTLEVRQAFRGEYLNGGGGSSAERYAYSAAWVLLATALLVAGLLRHRRTLRLASLPVMLLAVGKVFIYDTANLSDLYRVASFLGLGVSLLLLAWLYQRFVFRRSSEAA
jgi:uncharacterized membrane protein